MHDSDEDIRDEDEAEEPYDPTDAVIADHLGAEDPDALAPPEGAEIWLMEPEEVLIVRFRDFEGNLCRRIYVMGRSYVSKGYMFAEHRQRSERVAK